MKFYALDILFWVIGKVQGMIDYAKENWSNEWYRLMMEHSKRQEARKTARSERYAGAVFIQGTTHCDGEKLLKQAIEENGAAKTMKNLRKARRQIENYAKRNPFSKLADVNGADIIPSARELSRSINGRLTRS